MFCRRGNKDQEKVFEEELKKHDKMVAFIKQNIAAQENIIRFDYTNISVHIRGLTYNLQGND